MIMREKKILGSAIVIQKKIGGNHEFFSNNNSKKRLDTKQRVAFFPKLKLNYFWKMGGYP